MTNPAYEATNSDVEKLINCEIADFFAGIGQPGEPETPQEMQQQLQSRISAIFNAAPNGMMQLSNELAEMKRKCAELKASHHDLRESMAAIHNTIRGNGAYVSLSVLLTASENAWSKSASAEAITVESNDVITCWSCKKSMTLLERSSADGFCPHCDVEIDMQDDRAAGGTIEGSE